ncbi:hypothetical protein [Ancylobacter mangrovi]|uniref:hypothetical protein n=1 Tax=Ancylobacter mangrovi TaxID=2972472 RepID=UPI0021635ACB|nr:hypothetical protein [Ancylobacter mangrovi]MCS0501611.1 hypothetical protein [Ancylobacter mangrovi]
MASKTRIDFVFDGIGVIGTITIVVGAGMIYFPAGLIVAGLILLAIAILGART